MGKADLALALLAAFVLERLAPSGAVGVLALLAGLSLPFCAYGAEATTTSEPVRARAGCAIAALALCGLAALEPQAWVWSSVLVVWFSGVAVSSNTLRLRTALLGVAVGVGVPLAFGLAIALAGAESRAALAGALGRWDLTPHAAWDLAHALVVVAAGSNLLGKRDRPSQRLLLASSLVAFAALAAVTTLRLSWLGATLGLPTDMLTWSEAPALLNLLKLRAGAVFYGPMAELNSYSYSPALECLQYTLLRPLQLELSLLAHRVLGLVWQLLAAHFLARALAPWLLGVAPSKPHRLLLFIGCFGVLFSSLLAPHVHPDHLMMLCLCLAYRLVLREGAAGRGDLALLVALPVLATTVKLTGAGLGVGLVLAYGWERDWRRLRWLGVAGVLALATIPLFDAVMGDFSAYAIRLQSSHPFDVERTLRVWATPPLGLLAVALVSCGLAWRLAPRAPVWRPLVRALFLALGIGVTSLVGYAKHGGNDNSLLPFTLAAFVCLVLSWSAARDGARPTLSAAHLSAALAGALALVTPRLLPPLGEARQSILSMHQHAVAWHRAAARAGKHVFSGSTAAYIDAGQRSAKFDSLSLISELRLARRPELGIFERRVQRAEYDGLFLSTTTLLQNPALSELRPELEKNYAIVAPPSEVGRWPSDLQSYVIFERRAQATSAKLQP